ncbi:MAG: hypothetical protein JSV33_05480 [bacterium]|nr:MAG: hypothetical protein JSV33_05480 [bacterium]
MIDQGRTGVINSLRAAFLLLGLMVNAVAAILPPPPAAARPTLSAERTGTNHVSRRAAIVPGVSRGLARERAMLLSAVEYDLRFTIGDTGMIEGEAALSFVLERADRPLQIDFAGREVLSVSSGAVVPFRFKEEHILIEARYLSAGKNSLRIVFIPDEGPLHREKDHLYSLFVPAKARYVFPCFDQPDMKARFRLTLEMPGEWTAVSNAPVARDTVAGGRRFVSFTETEPLATYVFSFAAGRFRVETDRSSDRPMHCYHLEDDAEKVERNIKTIFELHATALEWMERYTGIPYPYGKFDFVLIPSFPYSGMEHAGAILYRAERLFLEENATERERLKRASVISHETAHMWFGDLVTMTWFDDVWLKEAFAQFMADRIVQPAFPDVNHRLLFVSSHFDPLHAVERTAGTHPIRQHLRNLNVAGSLYGNIIYHKPPVMLNQLEALMGEKALQEGLRRYLRRFGHGNARWEDLVTILDGLTDQDLETWSCTWVMEGGRPKITVTRPSGAGCTALIVHQDDPGGRGLLWPQYFELSILHGGEERIVPVFMKGQAACIEGVPVPDGAFILPNSGGHGFGYFVLDRDSRALLKTASPHFDDPLRRAVFAQVLRENFLEGAFTDPVRYLAILIREIERETVELNLQTLLDYLVETFWSFLPDTMREEHAGRIEKLRLEKLSAVETVSMKSTCFKAFRSVVTTAEGVAFMKGIWGREAGIEGLPLSERDYCTLALELAARAVRGWPEILDMQAGRTTDAVLEERFAFVRRAASPDNIERRSFFDGLSEASNRRHEPWVLEAVYYLHHPARIRDGEVCAGQSLEMLEEIRRTGDIFFPRDWAAATLRYHTSDAVVLYVKRFLVKHPRYPERLRLVVLQAADRLFRANRIRRSYAPANRTRP